MVKLTNLNSPTQRGTDCPTDEQIRHLIGDTLPEEAQSELISHLDNCLNCRRRLENATGDAEAWTTAGRSLQQPPPASSPELERVTAEMRSCKYDTIEQPQAIDFSDEQWELGSFKFLNPSDKPGHLGRLGSYEVLELLGQGGMGAVFKAYDPSLDRTVALKVLLAAPAQNKKARERFRREARAAASLQSEHLVAIHAVEDTARNPFLVMEYIDGTSLHDRLKQDAALSWEEIARIGAEIADGLNAAHSAGLVHRDIKPPNILLQKDTGRVKITDFGLARSLDDAGLTQTGYVVGTPEFMAPEQAEGASIDHRADLFSLGSVLYKMCVGDTPFSADTPLGVLRRTRKETPSPINATRPDVPSDLLNVVEKLMQKDPAGRFSSAVEVAQALRSVDTNRPAGLAPSRTAQVAGQQAKPKRSRVAWMAMTASVVVAIAFIASELSGMSHVMPAIAAAMSSTPPQDGSPKAIAAGDIEPSDAGAPMITQNENTVPENTAPVVEQPTRIQIVTPDGLMRESIRLQKDQLSETLSPHLIRKFEGHTGPVSDLAISPDGKLALSGSGWPSGDRTLRLWEIATGKEIRQFDLSALPLNVEQSGAREAPGEVHCVEFTPDGKYVAAGISGGAIGLWDVDSGKLIRQFNGHAGTVYGLDISPDGAQLLSGARDSTARLWDVSSGEELLRIEAGKAWVRSVAFSPDGKRALLSCYDNTMRYWDLKNAKQLSEMKFKNMVWSVAFSPDGSRGASGSLRDVTIWDLETSEPVVKLQQPDNVACVAFSPDGIRLLTGDYEKNVRLWDATDGQLIETYRGHRGWVFGIAFSPDGRTALSGGGGRYTPNRGTEPGIDYELRLWQLPKQQTRVAKPE